jgi:tRNA(Ile)-lysidine synthase TilS/MesJ
MVKRRDSSLVLLHFVSQVLSEEKNRVNQYSVCCYGQSLLVQEICAKYGIPFYGIIKETQGSDKCSAEQDQTQNETMRRVAVVYKRIFADKLYLPDTCNDLASTVFKLMIKGEGEVVPWEVQPVKSWFGMQTARPLREHHNLEINEYVRLRGLLEDESLSSNSQTMVNGINDLTERFFATLDQDYSASVSTVTKTAGKVSSNWTHNQDQYCGCVECGVPTRNHQDGLCHSCRINQAESLK